MAKKKTQSGKHVERLRIVTVRIAEEKAGARKWQRTVKSKDGKVSTTYGVNRAGYRFTRKQFVDTSKHTQTLLKRAERTLKRDIAEKGGRATVTGQFFMGKVDRSGKIAPMVQRSPRTNRKLKFAVSGEVIQMKKTRMPPKSVLAKGKKAIVAWAEKEKKKGKRLTPEVFFPANEVTDLFDFVAENLDEFAQQYEIEGGAA